MKVSLAILRHHMAAQLELLNSIITKRWVIGVLTATLALGIGQVSAQQSLRDKLSAAIETASGNQLKITALKKTVLPTIYEVQLSTGRILTATSPVIICSLVTCTERARLVWSISLQLLGRVQI